jgi:type IV pilus assembly protein PilC
MVAVGEKTGELDAMLQNLADYFQEEVDAAVKNISELIQPVLIVVMGGLIAIIMLAILWPIYNFGPAMNRPA